MNDPTGVGKAVLKLQGISEPREWNGKLFERKC